MTRRVPRAILAATFITLAACSSGSAQRTTTPTPPRDFDAYVARVLDTFEVPGAAIAIVKDGQVVLARGYGVR